MLADYHVHTSFSDDSTCPMERVVQEALRLGLDEICFTDHVDYGVKCDWDSGETIEYRHGVPYANVDYPRYFAQIRQLQALYADRIRIRTGLEFGIQRHTVAKYRALFRRLPLDFVLLSVHQVNDLEFWTQDFQRGKTQREYNEAYYEELLAVMREYHDYSVLAHLDLIARYDTNGCYPFERLRPIVEEILKTAIADGKGLEVNTSSHRYGLSDTTPSMEILRLYRKLGGIILTIGSDSHEPEQLGAYLAQTQALLRECGFRYFCTYEQMQPIFHRL